jgi:hypothetical protein
MNYGQYNYNAYTQPYMQSYNQPYMNQPYMNQGINAMNNIQPIQYNNTQQSVRVDFNGVVVNDFEDVRQYPTPLGGVTLLLNKKDKRFYIKQLDNNGTPIIETYSFESITNDNNVIQDNIDINSLNKRVEAIENKLKAD